VVAVRTPSLQLGVLQLSTVEVSPRSLPLQRFRLRERLTPSKDLVATHHRPHLGSVRDTRYIRPSAVDGTLYYRVRLDAAHRDHV
jgi:hypothetical protein